MTNILTAVLFAGFAGGTTFGALTSINEDTTVPIKTAVVVFLFFGSLWLRIEHLFEKASRDRIRDRNRSDQRTLWAKWNFQLLFRKNHMEGQMLDVPTEPESTKRQ